MSIKKESVSLFPWGENKLFFLCLVSLMLLAGCNTSRISYSPFPGMHISNPLSWPSGRHASLASGKGGHYKTGKPYKIGGRTYYPLSTAKNYDKTGVASWYGRDFHGKPTANGERYDMLALSAAHKTLPLPSLVRVTNLSNGRSVVVRVNDRGPFVKGRLIDLSWAAAKTLGYAGQGTTRVRVQSLGTHSPSMPRHPIWTTTKYIPSPSPTEVTPLAKQSGASLTGMYVQLGAFARSDNASKLKNSLSTQYPSIKVQPFMRATQTLYRVRIGPFSNEQTIEQTILSLQQQGYGKTVVITQEVLNKP